LLQLTNIGTYQLRFVDRQVQAVLDQIDPLLATAVGVAQLQRPDKTRLDLARHDQVHRSSKN
jgi:hypothetical protein